MHDEVELRERVNPRAGVAERGHLVAGALDPHLRLVRLAGEHGGQHRGDVAVHPAAEALVLAVAQALQDGVVRLELVLRVADEARGEDGGFLRRQALRASAAHLVRRAAGVPQVRRHAVERRGADGGLRRTRVHVGGHAQRDAAVRARAVQLDGLDDLLFLAAGDLGHGVKVEVGAAVLVGLERRLTRDGGAVGQRDVHGAEQLRVIRAVVVRTQGEGLRDLAFFGVEVHVALVVGVHVVKHCRRAQKLTVLRDALGNRRKADVVTRVNQERQVRPLLAERLVAGDLLVQLVLDDVVHPTEHHGHVGAGLDGQPHIGLRRVSREARVHDDGLAAVFAQLGHAAARRRRRMPRRTGAPDDVDFRQSAVLGRLVQLRAAGVGDGRVADAVDQRHGEVTRQVALRATRLEHVARAPEVAETRRAEELRVAAATGGAQKAVLAGFVAHVDHVLRNGFRRLVPADALPLVARLGAHALHGVLVAVGMVQRLDAGQALRAHAALRHGVDGIAPQLDNAPVADRGDDAAVRDACAARRAHLVHVVVGPCLVARLHVVRGSKPQRADGAGDRGRLHERATCHSRGQSFPPPFVACFTRL